MNRRHLFAALAALTVAPDELWIPGAKKIFLPPRFNNQNWMCMGCDIDATVAYVLNDAPISMHKITIDWTKFEGGEYVGVIQLDDGN